MPQELSTGAQRLLGVFAKQPLPGQVKTRLAQAIGDDAAARLYEAFLRDFVPRIAALPFARVLAYTPATAREYFRSLAGDDFELDEQSGADLGVRMATFFERRFRGGARQVVLVGSDTPDLPAERIEQAFAHLDCHDVVLGPCDDGGYYLIGMSRLIPELFTGIDWGGETVLTATVQRIANLSKRLFLLEPWYDVDRIDDLHRLLAGIEAGRCTGQEPDLRRTEIVLRSVFAAI